MRVKIPHEVSPDTVSCLELLAVSLIINFNY